MVLLAFYVTVCLESQQFTQTQPMFPKRAEAGGNNEVLQASPQSSRL